jgi:hypothetical protein
MRRKRRWSFITGATPNTPERTFHVAFTAEFKKSNNSLYVSPTSCVSLLPLNLSQNLSTSSHNAVEAMQYIVAIDDRRPFVFGISLKNASLRLWYANRSMLVGSKPLDISNSGTYGGRCIICGSPGECADNSLVALADARRAGISDACYCAE